MKQFYFTIIFLSFSLFALAQTTPTGNSTEVGTVEGQLTVSLTGGSNYSIPVAVPPGINGVVPKISLNYSSQNGFQGTAAQSWDIAGVSSITRIPSTKFHDGVIDPVDFDALDRFALDGQRLMVKNGTDVYGANGTVYETEFYSNTKITSYGVHPSGANYGPAYFIVEYPNGTKAYYGNSTDSRSVTTWSITNWVNPQGAQISYQYVNSTNTSYISSIKYGTLTPTAPINEIQFLYGTRTSTDNGYIGGINVIRDKNLSEIKVLGNGVGFRNYKLRYDELDKITQIDEKSGDNTKTLNPTIFLYKYLNSGIQNLPVNSNLNLSDITTKNTASISGDFDSDGKMDLILYRTSGVDMKNKYWLYTNIKSDNNNIASLQNIGTFEDIFAVSSLSSNNIVMPQGWALTKKTETNYTFTIYSKGSTNTVTEQYNKVVNFPLDLIDETCTSLCALQSQTGRIFPKKILSGDFNGDGLTDVIAIDVSASRKYCKENPQTGKCTASNEEAWSGKVYFVDLKRDLTTNFLFYAGQLPNGITATTRIEVADFNSDGKSDFFVFDQGYVKIYTLSDTNTLSLLYQNTAVDPAIASGMPILMGDYNGDGKFEFLIPNGFNTSSWSKYTSTGISLIKEDKSYAAVFTGNDASNTFTFFSTDTNGDGKTDLVSLKSNRNSANTLGTATLNIFSNMYGDFPSSSPAYSVQDPSINIDMLPIYSPQTVQSLDNTVNSVNSTLEIAFINQSKINFFTADQNIRLATLLAKITTGNGVEETIEYSTLNPLNTNADGDYIYAPSTALTYYPNLDIKINPNLYVVSKIQQKSKDVTKKRQFYYYGAVSNFQGLGFINFQSVNQTDWYDDTTTIFSNIVNNQINLRGVPSEKFRVAREYAPDGNSAPADFITKSIITYNTPTDALQTNKVFKLKTLSSKDFNSLNNANSETTNIVYDTYNNVTSSTLTEKEGVTTLRTTNSTAVYSNLPASSPYVIGRPTSQTQSVTASGDTMTSEELFTYTNSLLTQSKKKGANTDYITEDNQYDSFGNITKKTISSPTVTDRVTSYEYDTSGRFLTKITDSELLATTFEYNQSNGLLIKETNPYQLSTSYTYDSWFKKFTVTDNKLNKTITYNYTRNVEKTVVSTTTDTLDGDASEETFDDLGRKIKSGSKDINGTFSYVSYLYDIFDRNYKVSEPYFGATPTQWNETKFDIYNRPTQTIRFNNRTISNSYPTGLISTTTDGAKSKTITKNAIGDVISSGETLGGNINYTYFANENLKQTSYNGINITLEQDGWGRKTKLIDPSAGTFTYKNNVFGEATEETSQNGAVVTTITRDSNGRPTKKTIIGGGTNSETLYTYDTTKLPLTITYTDKNESTNNVIVTTITYDNAYKRVLTIEESKAGVSKFTKSFTYDGLGRIDTETKLAEVGGKSSSVKTKNVYKNGDLYQILDINNKVLWQANTLNAKGQILESVLGNGIKMTNTFDTDGYLSKIQYDKTTAPAANILTLTTAFDKNTDYLKSRINSAFSNYSETFFYDAIGRLNNFTNKLGAQEDQTYDASGKITSNALGTYDYDPTKKYQNTSISLTPQATGYYANREGIFNDSMEDKAGWGTSKYPNTNFFSYDITKTPHATGKTTLKLANTTTTEQYVFSDKWTAIDNAAPTQYTYSAWVYSDSPQAQIFLVMKDAAGNITYDNIVSSVANAWTPITKTFSVPANIKNISIRLDNNGLGNIWYDDVEIRKTSDPTSIDRKLIVSYNAFKSPIQIEETNVDKISFTYNEYNQRSMMYYGGFQTDKLLRPLRKYYSGDGTMEVKENRVTGTFEFVTYIGGNGYTAPIVAKSDGTNPLNYLYLHRDYQGTIMAITDANAAVVEKRLYDAWGSIIKIQDGAGNSLTGLTVLDRGYTGHEHLQSVGLINMNARLYDPLIHRFLQVDNYIQDPTSTQNYNPYGYVLNNPLLYTDPSGDFSNKFWNTLLEQSSQTGVAGTTWYPDGNGNFNKAGTNYFTDQEGNIGENLPNITISSKNGSTKNASLIQNHVYANSSYYSSLAPAHFTNLAFTGAGIGLSSFLKKIDALSDLKNFNATSFNPEGTYEFMTKTRSVINDGRIYEQGTAEAVTNLKILSNLKYVNYGAGALSFGLSVIEYRENKISGAVLAIDGAMGLVSFTGVGTPFAAVYFVLIRSDTKDKHFIHKPESIYNNARVQIDNTRVSTNNIIPRK